MSRKAALLVSSALTAFVLVTMAGMALVLRATEVAGAEAAHVSLVVSGDGCSPPI